MNGLSLINSDNSIYADTGDSNRVKIKHATVDTLEVGSTNIDLNTLTNLHGSLEIDDSKGIVIGTTKGPVLDAASAVLLHLHKNAGGGSNIQFTNNDTGTTSNSGFRIGLAGTEFAQFVLFDKADFVFDISSTEAFRLGDTSGTKYINIIGGGEYRIGGTSLLNETTLGSSIINSSLTSVGTLSSLNMGGNIDLGTNDITNATNITGTNLTGTLQTAAQPNITSVGTLTSLNVSGDFTVDTNLIHVDSTSNFVGIITNSPQESLHVAGDIFHEGTNIYRKKYQLSFNPSTTTTKYTQFIGRWAVLSVMKITIVDSGNNHGSSSEFVVTRDFGDIPRVHTAKNGLTPGKYTLHYRTNGVPSSADTFELFFTTDATTNAIINYTVYVQSQGLTGFITDTLSNSNDSNILPCNYSIQTLNNGNVGINTNNPQYNLDVFGSSNSTSLYIGGTQVIDSSRNATLTSFNTGTNTMGGHVVAFTAERNSNSGSGTFGAWGNGTNTSTMGPVLYSSGKVIFATVSASSSSTATIDVQIRSNTGTLVSTPGSVSLTSARTNVNNFTTNNTFSSGQYLTCTVTSGTFNGGFVATIFVRYD